MPHRKPNLEEWRSRGWDTIAALATVRGIPYGLLLAMSKDWPRKAAYRPAEVSPGSCQRVIVVERARAMSAPLPPRVKRQGKRLGITCEQRSNKLAGIKEQSSSRG